MSGPNRDRTPITVVVETTYNGSDWTFPKISILGARSEEEYERITDSYVQLAIALQRLVRARRRPLTRGSRERQRAVVRPEAIPESVAWIQLTLAQQYPETD